MEKDEKKVLKWLLLSAEQKNQDSMCILGELYMNGTPGLEKNWKEAEKWFQLSARHGHKKAIPFLRYLYMTGGPGLEKIMEKRSNGYSRWQTKETGNPLIFWDNCTCLAAPDLRRITGKQPNT